MWDALDSIRAEVIETTQQYARHRHLLEELMETITKVQDGDSEPIERAIPPDRDRSILNELLEETDAKKEDVGPSGEEGSK